MLLSNTRSSVSFVSGNPQARIGAFFAPGAVVVWTKEEEHFSFAQQLGGGMRPDLIVARMEKCHEVSRP
ncbi:ribokinase [Apiospora rasikravindrae]|uniref:Ribokinase n=1 Tax=Apiospora rasikravindrae TaxID=990691 RepID=A0ABR1SCH6_9PEZI